MQRFAPRSKAAAIALAHGGLLGTGFVGTPPVRLRLFQRPLFRKETGGLLQTPGMQNRQRRIRKFLFRIHPFRIFEIQLFGFQFVQSGIVFRRMLIGRAVSGLP